MVLVLISSTGLSFTWNSFRNQSTAGLLDDDYDLLLDPARLPLIEGSRLYTSLANLVDKDEEVFDDTGNGYWLIGGSAKLGEKIYPGLVHDRFSLKTPQDFYLRTIDNVSVPFRGEGELVDSRLVDVDGDGTYDREEIQQQTAEGLAEDNSSDYYVGVGSYLGTARVGLFYHFADQSYTSKDAGNNYTLAYTQTDLIGNALLYDSSASGTGDYVDELSAHTFGLAAWMPAGEQLTVGARFSYSKLSMEETDGWRRIDAADRSPGDPQDDIFTGDENSTETVPRAGSSLWGSLRCIYDWTEDVETWVDLNFGQLSGDIEADAGRDYHLTDEWRTTVGPADSVLSITNGTTADISGDFSEKSVGLFTRTIANLAENVIFAFGLGLGTGNYESTTRYDEDRVDRMAVDDGDGVPERADFTQTVTESQVVDTTVTGSGIVLSFPVGVEFKLKNPLSLRLGARHDIDFTDETINHELVNYSAPHTRIDYGDGTYTESIPDTTEPINGTSETVKRTESETHYYYGLGYRVSDNLQIDLMGFSDLTDLSDWKLSAVFSF